MGVAADRVFDVIVAVRAVHSLGDKGCSKKFAVVDELMVVEVW